MFVPDVFRRNQSGDVIRTPADPLCYYAVSFCTLCHFGRTGNGYVANNFILLSSAAESSATSGYVVVPDCFGQNEEPASRNKEQTRKKPSCVLSSGFNRCNLKADVNITLSIIYLYFFFLFLGYF